MGHIGCGRYVLWLDQLSWMVVCRSCYQKHKGEQWTGFINPYPIGSPMWRKHKKRVTEIASSKTRCEICGRELPPWSPRPHRPLLPWVRR